MDSTNEEINMKRIRRHTIARPASALGLLSDSMDCDEDIDDYQFDRISHILSSLIQEANEAVSTSPTTTTTSRPTSIPLVRKLSSSSSSSDQQRYHKKRSNYRSNTRPLSYPSCLRRPSHTSVNAQNRNHNNRVILANKKLAKQKSTTDNANLTESFERLNSSLAIVDSLSRDLAVTNNGCKKTNSTERVVKHLSDGITKTATISKNSIYPHLSALLWLPLLPHILITTAFDSTASKLSDIVIWAFLLTITNLVAPAPLACYLKENIKLLPGSFSQKTPTDNTMQFSLDTNFLLKPKGFHLKRRNSL